MPREIVTIQVGQCGNQIGLRWWDILLQEHKANPQYPEARDALFNTARSAPAEFHTASDERHARRDSTSGSMSGAGAATSTESLKARCVAVDMEQGVLSSMLRDPLGHLFDSTFFVSDVSGAGNNWAVGHMEYGDRYVDVIAEAVRGQVEQCDCIQSFLIMHSLSGGTGSGLGTRVLGMLEEEFPHVFRISPVVLPSQIDDVVTAPYNSCFSLKELIEHADCVLPMDNDALARMADRANGIRRAPGGGGGSGIPSTSAALPAAGHAKNTAFNAAMPTETRGLPYDSMNALAAQMLSNLTCGMRFPGPLNMDINEVTTNLVPYPRLNMLTAAIAPLSVSKQATVGPRTVDTMISACLDKEHQFVDLTSGSSGGGEIGTSLATAIIARGPQITIGDLTRNVARMHARVKLPYWNEDGFKTALCGVSPLGHKDSVLMLTNNCAMTNKIRMMHDKFMRLYSVRSHVHHYEQYLSESYFESTAETLRTMLDDYDYLNTARAPKDVPRSMKDLVYY